MNEILLSIARAGGYLIYRDMVILENLRNNNYEMKKTKERLRHNLRKGERMKSIVTNEDNMVMMGRYHDKFFDLAIVDPEYRDNNQPDKSMRKKGLMSGWFGAPNESYFKELMRVSKDQIIFGGNYFTKYLEPNNNWLIWYKNNDGLHMSMCEMAWVSIRKNTKVFDFRPMGHNVDWHPTAKPIHLYNYILKTYGNLGDKILDTHLGSGSSRIAAYDLGFDFYGCELDKDYFEAQENRFTNHCKQIKLFSPTTLPVEQTTLFS